jgi:hypothetical protein
LQIAGIGNNTFLLPNTGVVRAKNIFTEFLPSSVDIYMPLFLSIFLHRANELLPTASKTKSNS